MTAVARLWSLMLAWLLCTPAAVAVASDAAADPQMLIVTATEDVQSELRRRSAGASVDPDYLRSLIDSRLVPHFDFNRISRLALGKHWRRATPEQRETFSKEFSELLIRSYANVLVDYASVEVMFLPPRRGRSDREVTVRSRVPQRGAAPVSVDYVMYLHKSGWRVFDVRIDGISLVSNYRTSFTRELSQTGMDNLIATLVERNQAAAAP